MYAGLATLAATTSDIIGTLLAARAAQGLPYGQGVVKVIGSGMATAGARVGLFSSLFVAGLDVNKAYSEYQEGADGLVIVSYAGSALVGIGLSAALVWASLLGAAAIPVLGFLFYFWLALEF